MSLWTGTPIATVVEQLQHDRKLRAAYHLGQVDQTVSETFGIGPDESNVPGHVQRFALVMLDTLMGGRPFADAERELAAIVQQHQGSAN